MSLEGSLGRRLLLAFLVLLAVAGSATYLGVRRILYANLDRDLATRAQTVAALVELENGAIELDLPVEFMPEFGPGERPDYFELRLASGEVVARSRSLEGRELARTAGWASGDRRPIVLPDGRPGRAVLLRFVPEADRVRGGREGGTPIFLVRPGGVLEAPVRADARPPELALVVAGGDEVVRASLRRLATGFALGSLALVALGLVLIRRTVHAALQPVGDLAGAMSAIGARSLGRRLDAPRTAELRPIAETLNGLLARLEAAFERERRFTSSAAHELRTPIAELRTLAELTERWPADPDVAAAAASELGELARQMERIVTTLLLLARAEAGLPVAGAARPTAVGDVLERVFGRLERRAGERDLDFDDELPPDIAAEVDPLLLERVLANLLENAVEYTPRGGRIRVRVEPVRAGPEARFVGLVVANTTDGTLDDEALRHFFEPFWRSDPSHEDGTRHVGLGLPLVKTLAEAMGGRASAELAGRELRLRVDLPRAGAPDGDRLESAGAGAGAGAGAPAR